jgi:cyclopropane-fatty-acyl-phospholipid synthase
VTTLSPDQANLGGFSAPRLDTSHWPDLTRAPNALKRTVHARVARRLFEQAARRLDVRVELPDGTALGRAAHVPNAPVMVLHRPERFLERLGADALIGFGESYMAGDWDSPDLGALLTVFAERMATLVPEPLQRLRALYVSRLPRTERNTTTNTRSNISRHYDLSNAMFEQFLDETMSYSSALFDTETLDAPAWADLAPAQARKIERLLDQAGVGAGTRVLEIGTGWGELAIRAARRGATVHSVTLSKEQQGLARRRIREAGVEDRVSVELKDYREVRGEYDAVVSVEMIEAVGYEYWPTYFRSLDAVLAPGGAVAIQAITMPHDRMLATRNTYTWVHKYIFPGGFLPSTEAIEEVTRTHTTLRVVDRLSLGDSYAQTLRLWDERFVANAGAVGRLGFDAIFRRMWHFYLEYSRAGFASGYLDVQQIVLRREGSLA